MVAEDEFFEYAEVYGEGKGVPRAPVRAAIASGRDVLLRVDIQGAATVAAAIPACIRVFIAPPSLADLERRLRERNSDAPDALARRLATARQEIERAGECDYIVINHQGRLDETVRDLEAIMTAERLRVRRRRLAL
jgi:guanylate kinase